MQHFDHNIPSIFHQFIRDTIRSCSFPIRHVFNDFPYFFLLDFRHLISVMQHHLIFHAFSLSLPKLAHLFNILLIQSWYILRSAPGFIFYFIPYLVFRSKIVLYCANLHLSFDLFLNQTYFVSQFTNSNPNHVQLHIVQRTRTAPSEHPWLELSHLFPSHPQLEV